MTTVVRQKQIGAGTKAGLTLPPKIQDYAIIGNGRSAALVSRFGSIDWLCWPRFDSGSLFAAILDPNSGGAWSICPRQSGEITRSYIEKSNVLETRFRSESGTVVLTDLMPVASEEEKRRALWPEHEIIREIKCEAGCADVEANFAPRPDYARMPCRLKKFGALGIQLGVGPAVFILRSDAPLELQSEDCVTTKLTMRAGDRVAFSLSCATESPAVVPALGDLTAKKLQLTVDWWRQWVDQSNYDDAYARYVTRSALVLKLLSYAPSGAIIAAPTTSLPEKIGGERNWDYRLAWLRDASFVVRALFGLGYRDDAEAFVNWLLHATRLTRPELCVVYDVFGERPADEKQLDNLSGYRDSRPVRIGNAAKTQFQLDVYGEVAEAVTHFVGTEKQLDRDVEKMLRQCGEYVCEHWREPDHGIWEYRDARRHYTHSRLMCWVALDRLLQLYERGQLCEIDADKVRRECTELRRAIETENWNQKDGAYVQASENDQLDVSALLLGFYEFEPATSHRLQQTHVRIRERLSTSSGLLWRDERSRDAGEGAFAFCSFWEVDFLARSGRVDEAKKVFESVLADANDVDLFGEEISDSGDALGNFPQGFTHLGVINAALSIQDAEERATKKVDHEH